MSALHKLQVLLVITLLMPLAAHANPDAGKFYFIAGTALIYPDLKYNDPTLQLDKNIPVLGSFLQNRQISIPGTAIDVSDISLIGGSLGYQVTDHLALEAVAGFPGTIHFVGSGLLEPLGHFADFKTGQFIPLLLNVLYEPFPAHAYRPYIGAGPALAWIRKAEVTNPLVDRELALEFPQANWGWGVQAGIQVHITEQWFMRLDAKYLRIYVNEVKLKVNALDQALNITIANAQMALPLISFGIGRSF
jgi:outer membrane protein W